MLQNPRRNPPFTPPVPSTVVIEDPEDEFNRLRVRLAQQIREGTLSLPPLPRAALELQKLANNPNATLEDAVQLLERDPPMAGLLLRVANSAAFAAAQRITELRRAVMRLGLLATRDLALGASMGQVIRSGAYMERARQHTRHAFTVACGVQWLSKRMGVDAGYGFICGLLHDVGTLVVLSALGSKDAQKLSEVETDLLLERLHEDAGALALNAWQLPPLTVEVARSHHKPQVSVDRRSMVLCVHAVDVLDASAATDADLKDTAMNTPTLFECGLSPEDVAELVNVLVAARKDAVIMSLTG